MTAEFVIPTRLPGMNEYTDACRRHAQVGAKMKHNNQEIAAWAIKTQLRGVKFDRPVEITYMFYEPNRRRDKSNVAAFGIKVIEDALVMCGVLKDLTGLVRDLYGIPTQAQAEAQRIAAERLELERKKAEAGSGGTQDTLEIIQKIWYTQSGLYVEVEELT